jgi:hypothetical protein
MDSADLYRRWINELWCGAVEKASELVAADFVGHWPDREVRGVDQLAELIVQTHVMLTSLSFAIEVDPFAAGAFVAGRWRGRGQQEGRDVEFVGNDILRVSDGKFVEYWVATATLS